MQTITYIIILPSIKNPLLPNMGPALILVEAKGALGKTLLIFLDIRLGYHLWGRRTKV